MALTNFAALTTEQKTAWAMDLWRTARNQSFVMKFTGKGHNSLIQRITELTKTEKGARAVMTLLADLTGDGVVGDYTLEGNEEEIKAYDTVVQIDQLRNANRLKGKLADQKSIVNFRKSSRDVLAYWLADRIDQIAFLTLSSIPLTQKTNGALRPVKATGQNFSDLEFAVASPAPSTNRSVYLTSAGIQNGTGYDATDGSLGHIRYQDIVNLQARAKDEYIRGIKTGDGEEIYHMFVTPQGMAKLKLDPDYIANVRNAATRGTKNALFAGSNSVMVDGVMVHQFRHVYSNEGAANGARFGTTNGNDVGQRALFCGAQALGMADLGVPGWFEKEFDYDNQAGIRIEKMLGFLKPQFKGNPLRPDSLEDFGVITVDTAL
ncbi:DUF4043 family protein [Motiliproteus coralliicola]|uniref:DUF4043 family protein n=1 Tax=Motiliproteus coralliicola TaxID=2283196 RepID=A0A369WSQ9_9GAMM|nr:DUF4043 family protein [Motiliproteus coralliicola]RDE25130.1 DUF4043 family protein [Motiliproteus coralliicola]